MDAVAEIAEEFADRARDVMGETLPGKTGPGIAIKAAVTGAITKAAVDFGKRKASEMLAGNQRQPARRV